MPTPIFFNTLGRSPQPLEPLVPGEIRLYTCGPTVYGHVHIGNLRAFLFEDILRPGDEHHRRRRQDDRSRGQETPRASRWDEYTQPFIDSFFRDLDTLHVERAEEYPAGHGAHVPEMIELIESADRGGHAYESDGSVFFRIGCGRRLRPALGLSTWPRFGRGSGWPATSTSKEDARDFVLWKGAKAGTSRPGTRPGGRVVRVGTSSARR